MTKKKKKFSRRKFLVRGTIGVGVLIGTAYFTRHIWRRSVADMADKTLAPYTGNTKSLLIWFEVRADNSFVLHSPKVEMGQGTFTGLAQIVADEMEIHINDITVIHAQSQSGNLDPFATGGSTSISSLWNPLRELSATMREMLLIEASRILSTSRKDLSISDGIISSKTNKISYAEVVAKTSEWKIPQTPELKKISEYKYVGRGIPRVDLNDKVIGAPIYGMDASLENLVYGAVVRPDVIDSILLHVDVKVAEKMPGVIKILQEDDFVGVIAESFTEAENAKNAIRCTWKSRQNWQLYDIEELIKIGQGNATSIQKEGKAEKILNTSAELTEEYFSPIGAHAQIEPNGALAHVIDGKATIIMSTQVVKLTRNEVAKRLGIKPKDVNVIPTFLGGGFGRRLHTPNAVQAAVMSRAVGRPVKCFLSRKDEFQHDTFRPPTHHKLRAKLVGGKIEAIDHNLSSGDVMFGSPLVPAIAGSVLGADVGAWRGGMIQYSAIPNIEATSWRVKLPFATSWWRSLGLLANTFAIESFMDEAAEKLKIDPIECRLMHISDDDAGTRLKAVIKDVREMSSYSDKPRNGRAMGFAASTDAKTPCAQVVELSIESNQLNIHKVWCSIDPGLAVNPDQVKAQCEGSICMGISASCYEQMTIKNSKISPTIYGPYKMALMRHTPKDIEVNILQGDDAPGAVGEPPLGPIGAAIANAIYRLTGKRKRRMPLWV